MSDVVVVDLRGEPVELDRRRWRPHDSREATAIRGVVLHAWDTAVGTTPEARRRWGEPVALARRALRAPYSISCGVTRAGVPVVALAHPLARYTFASDAGNREWLSVGVMGHFPLEEATRRRAVHCAWTDALEQALDWALQHAVQILDDATRGADPWSLITHRQCVNGPRDHDACPGECVVASALRSRPVTAGLLVPDADLVLDGRFGRPWPTSWRSHLPAPRKCLALVPDASDHPDAS